LPNLPVKQQQKQPAYEPEEDYSNEDFEEDKEEVVT